jgi:transposase InsO family protein
LYIILDAFSRAIIGWSMQDNLKRELVLNSLNMAYKKRFHFPKGIIFHSDKGSQYSSKEVRKYLKLNEGIS